MPAAPAALPVPPLFAPLIGATELAEALRSSSPPRVLDASFELGAPGAGEASYRAGHIPGALYVDLERELSGPTQATDGRFLGRHPLPDPAELAASLGRWGIDPATQVVVVDRQGGMMAARAWWLLRWIGHRAVAVLDGGMGAWIEAGGALARVDPAAPACPPYPLPGSPGGAAEFGMATLEAKQLQARLGRVRLLDARAAERFRGEVEPLDRCAGHIPGARNRFYKDNLLPDGRFKPASLLRAEFEILLAGQAPKHMVQSCGSGVTACHNLYAMELAGLAGSVLYPGSWSEWSADSTRPVARG